ncbi:single-stranded DNA-binding protein [Mucilaginibacter paludis]|uniref:Single-stranded DNA-binding protein n=1 Tax=Mucilaginibacter paludis DSM 18603 TaxID=714943 RepID=H1YDT7_9SPHI|nr:single-stranded DNA-binding protein [Mucilaginibacter paludis]EHQ24277.1 single-strand binding protein [Mucilaginibacter paludis DSM 18603]
MQQITGKLTADATVKTLESGKEVVRFSIVDNDSYKPKGSDETKQIATFFNCSYWFNTNVAKVLRKGAVVRLDGRLSARGYTTNTGDNGASLDFLANYINVLAYAAKKESETNAAATASEKATDEKDDLPF